MKSSYNLTEYETAVFDKWLEIYKRSATTRLLLEAISDKPRYSGEIHEYINKSIGGKWSINEKSMHRTLRRLDKLDLVSFNQESTAKTGLKKKVYSITPSGKAILGKMNSL